MAVRGELSREAVASKPGEAAGVLRGREGATACLRVHAQGQLGEPPLQKRRIRPAHVLGPASAHRHRRRPRPRLPARGGEASHLPGLQGLQHPPRHALQRQALRLRPREERPHRRRQPRHHPGAGHLRLRGAGVRRHGPPVREERRVRLRRGAAGDAHGPARARHGAAGAAAQPGGLGQAVPGGPPEAGAAHGPAPGGAILVQGGAPGGPAHAALPLRRPQEPPRHGRGRRAPRGGRADEGAAQARVAGRGRVAPLRRAERGRRTPLVAAEVRVRRRAEPPVSPSEVAAAERPMGQVFSVLGFSRHVLEMA